MSAHIICIYIRTCVCMFIQIFGKVKDGFPVVQKIQDWLILVEVNTIGLGFVNWLVVFELGSWV